MSRPGNAPRRLAATAVLLLTLLILGPSLARAAQQRPADAPPSPADTLAAFRDIEPWIRAWETPAEPQMIDPEGTAAACVTLRLAGQVLGRGTAVSEEGDALWAATRDAWIQATAAAPIPRDALRDQALRDMGQRVMIDVQLAGRFTPILGATFNDATAALSPGIQGVAARTDDRVQAFFPGAMLSTNTTPGRALVAACGALDLPPIELGELQREHGVIAYRFRAQHLAQPAPGAEPIFLYRGGRAVSLREIDADSIRTFADRLALHLQRRDWPGREPVGMLGSFEPWSGRFDPLIASPTEQALTAFALFRYAGAPGVRPADAARACRAAWTLLDELTEVEESAEAPPLQDTTFAPALLAAWHARLPRPPGMAELFTQDAPLLINARTALAAQFTQEEGFASSLPPAAHALVAYALAAESLAAPENSEARSRASAAVRRAFRETPPGRLVSMMPWLGWAELLLAGDEGAIPSAGALTDMREQVWQFQMGFADTDDDSLDLVGGIVFTAARTPLPTAQSARPFAFAATMLGDPRLTPENELAAETARLLLGVRFLRQLAVDDAVMHMLQDPERALWGVRVAPWDQRLSIDASVTSLLTLTETLRALDRLARSAEDTTEDGS